MAAGSVALATTLTAAGIAVPNAAASAPPTTTSTTSTSTTSTSTTQPAPTTTTIPVTVPTTVPLLPPPPPFPLGDDSGRLLLQRRADATAALAGSESDIANLGNEVALQSEHLKVASHAVAQAQAYARAVARKLVAIRAQIKALAVDAYMLGASVQITGTLASFASSRDVVSLSRNLTFVHSSHDRLGDLVAIEHHEQDRAATGVRTAQSNLAAAQRAVQTANENLAGAQSRHAAALATIDQTNRDQVRFFADAVDSASPIMGPVRLTADQLVAYVASLHLHPKLTVSLRTLAGYYISEGEKEGVRGDVAFAQSILETGAFMFPGHGLLDPGDNNFAGIDACDSCKHGDKFKTALLGVRAQIQLLRVYADPTVKKVTDFPDPIALLHTPRLSGSGHSKTWYSLGGTWATGPNYGFHVYDIYLKIVALSERH